MEESKNKEEVQKLVTVLKETMADMRDDKYALVNSEVAALDEYVKTLYLKLLCTLVQYENETTEGQLLFLKRIVKGTGVEEPMEEYMRMALEISAEDLQEFLTIMKERIEKYYFVLDGLILVSLGNANPECYGYLAEIIEVLDVPEEDLRCISMVAKSVVAQDSSYYDNAIRMLTERVKYADYSPYIQNYYSGILVNTDKVKVYQALNNVEPLKIEFPAVYQERKVVFRNLQIRLLNSWSFEGCKEVFFENCEFTGGSNVIIFNSCKNIRVINCKFKHFFERVFIEKGNGNIQIEGCEFEHCVYAYSSTAKELVLGGVFYTESSKQNAKNRILNSIFRHCGGKNTYSGYAYTLARAKAIISNSICEVIGCQFFDCGNYRNEKIDSYHSISLFMPETVGKDNEFVGSTKFK